MPVDRLLPTQEAEDLLELTRDLADKELATRVEEHERAETYPEGLFATLGHAGLLGLPYPEEVGGGGQPYEVYLQVLEELAARWAAVAVATSVHSLSCFPLYHFGSDEQRARLPEMLGGGMVGGYSLSEPQAGSDAAALRCRAEAVDGGYRITGTKAWITHGGRADFYALFARTAAAVGDGAERSSTRPDSRAVSCFLAPGQVEGLSWGRPEEKMGLHAVPTATANWDGAVLEADRLIGREGQGLEIAFSALDSGRLGIAACAVGLAQAALDAAVDWACTREVRGGPLVRQQAVEHVLAEMATRVEAARLLVRSAASSYDDKAPAADVTSRAAMAKLFATESAQWVVDQAVQLHGARALQRGHLLERLYREVRAPRIYEGASEVQRTIIGRGLVRAFEEDD